ncbi:MAG: type II toxin-antitoxin system RelE/ParE family toxin [Paracoccaceae bacterium]|nr:type II toxin-antitoxin system RelE/ParE family toxin [Paracoccaceae bacterium]MDE2912440.1 type II toxin-antitoxin system RelE/ParE family toxin [Paracoccaceae bacterium]
MAWRVELDPAAERELGKLDRQAAKRILTFLRNRIAQIDNPRAIGKALLGSGSGDFWRCRVGDYRIIATIEDSALRVLVLRIGHRRNVYRQ